MPLSISGDTPNFSAATITTGTITTATIPTATVTTLNAPSGVLATQNGMTGIGKAWVNFDASSGSSATIRGSFNVSSVTWVSTGQYQINYTTAMPNANYAVTGTSGYTQGGGGNSVSYLSFRGNLSTAIATTSVTVITSFANASLQDAGTVCVAAFSS